MSVKARWHQAVVLELDDSDPFADEEPVGAAVTVPVDVKQVGSPIDLAGPRADLSRRLVENIEAQQALVNKPGASDCDLRWDAAITCHACPLFTPDTICVLAREQEAIETLMAIEQRGGGK